MDQYDPLVAPDPQEWLDIDESERIALVEEYHRRARVQLPNAQIHATVHTVIENQAALGDETPVRRALDRLMFEGLDRHDAIHAIGLVFTEHVNEAMKDAERASPTERQPRIFCGGRAGDGCIMAGVDGGPGRGQHGRIGDARSVCRAGYA